MQVGDSIAADGGHPHTPEATPRSRLAIDAEVLPVSVCVNGLLGVPDNPRQPGCRAGAADPVCRPAASSSMVMSTAPRSGSTRLFRLRDARPGDDVLLMNAACG